MIFKSKSTYDFLVVGLGNPGLQYENTRHNAGFMALDCLIQKHSGSLSKNKFNALLGEIKIANKRILIAKPQTYMNNSGSAIRDICTFYKLSADKIIVMFDDISLDIGKIRLRRKGSAGGHNGIKDIITLLSTEDIMRIKIGVGQKPHPDYDLKDWVLGKIPKAQQEDFNDALLRAAAACEEIIWHGIDSAMNKYSK
ncbi:MAG: aminoacyl-tRNA hydrolase [Clostridia bacterium]|nr:aminoacyl-tRNA hydrolase [Clostridia bacterium]